MSAFGCRIGGNFKICNTFLGGLKPYVMWIWVGASRFWHCPCPETPAAFRLICCCSYLQDVFHFLFILWLTRVVFACRHKLLVTVFNHTSLSSMLVNTSQSSCTKHFHPMCYPMHVLESVSVERNWNQKVF